MFINIHYIYFKYSAYCSTNNNTTYGGTQFTYRAILPRNPTAQSYRATHPYIAPYIPHNTLKREMSEITGNE